MPKTAKMAFLTVNNFFLCTFKNTNLKNNCASIEKLKHEDNCFWGVFFKNQKHTFLGVKNGTFSKSNLKFVFLRLCINVKGSFMPIFTKNINIWAPWNFLKMKL